MVFAVGALFIGWVLRLPRRTRNFFMLAGALYVTGGLPLAEHPFALRARRAIDGLTVFDSYHCSRYNTNTSAPA